MFSLLFIQLTTEVNLEIGVLALRMLIFEFIPK